MKEPCLLPGFTAAQVTNGHSSQAFTAQVQPGGAEGLVVPARRCHGEVIYVRIEGTQLYYRVFQRVCS